MLQIRTRQTDHQRRQLAACEIWKYDKDDVRVAGEFHRVGDAWLEFPAEKEHAAWQEVRRTATHVDLADAKRTRWIRLAAEQSWKSTDGKNWTPHSAGSVVEQ